MGIAYGDDTIVVTGGSPDDPYTMDDLENDGVVGQYVTPGGYGNREFAVSKDLIIGSEDADTFFDLTDSIITMDSGVTLTVYTSALRGGKMGDTWGSKFSNTPLTTEELRMRRIQNIRKLYIEEQYRLGASGAWSATTRSVVAVRTGQDIA